MIIRMMTKAIEKKGARSSLIRKMFDLYYEDKIRREIALGQITANDHLLFIGGGPLPWSAIKIAEFTGARVTVIDSDCQAVQQAISVVRGLALEHLITVRCGQGETEDASLYTAVHVAVQVTSRRKILQSLMAGARPGTKILVRCPFNKLSDVCFMTPDDCLCESCVFGSGLFKWASETLLFIKDRKETICNETQRDGEKIFAADVRLDYHLLASQGQ